MVGSFVSVLMIFCENFAKLSLSSPVCLSNSKTKKLTLVFIRIHHFLSFRILDGMLMSSLHMFTVS